MTADKILPIFEEYDMILPRKYEFGCEKGTIYKAYTEGHSAKDMNIALDFIKKEFPDMAQEADSFKNEHNQMYPCNMLVCSKKLFDEYAQWLFAVLFEVEKNIKDELPLRDPYQQRALGFLGERMTKIFVDYKIRTADIKVKEMPFLFFETDEAAWKQYLKEYRHYQRKMLKRKILTAIGLGKKKWQKSACL